MGKINKIIYLTGAYQILRPLYDLAVHQYLTAQDRDLSRYHPGTALVTGGSDGIGKEFARALSKSGFDVAISSRSISKLEKAKAEIGAESIIPFDFST